MSIVEEASSSTGNRKVVDVDAGGRLQAEHMAAMVAEIT